jgi:hypothetical protein
MWFLADIIGLLSANVVSFSSNVVPSAQIFSANLVPKTGCNRFLRFMLSGRYTYGPARGLCRAEPASGSSGSALECGPGGRPRAADAGAGARAAEGHQPGLRAGAGRNGEGTRDSTRLGRLGAGLCRGLCRAAWPGAGERDRGAGACRPVRAGGIGTATAEQVRRAQAWDRRCHGTEPDFGRADVVNDPATAGTDARHTAGARDGRLCSGLGRCRPDGACGFAGAGAPGIGVRACRAGLGGDLDGLVARCAGGAGTNTGAGTRSSAGGGHGGIQPCRDDRTAGSVGAGGTRPGDNARMGCAGAGL